MLGRACTNLLEEAARVIVSVQATDRPGLFFASFYFHNIESHYLVRLCVCVFVCVYACV